MSAKPELRAPGFAPVTPAVSFPELDREVMAFWDAQQIFEKSMQGAAAASGEADKGQFIFYEGPPTANGMPHPGHVLTRVMKDVFLRYRSMCGYQVPRIGGWDTHGLPVEVEVEKELGITGRKAIQEYGIEAFTRRCVESVFRYIGEWRKMTRRIGFWVDLDAAYVTFHRSYVESVWWALSEFWKQGLLFQDYKVVWWWPQGGTALSAGEVGQGYRTIDDPSIVVRFPVQGQERTSLLAWTTTPWTLPSNIALAVNAGQTYQTLELDDGERVIVAAALRDKLLKGCSYQLLREQLGKELVGTRYEPPFRYQAPEGGDAYLVIAADFVSMDTGSGLVHVAPAFGEDDFRAAKAQQLGFLQLVEPDGKFSAVVSDFAGRFCKEADRDIIRNLRQRGLLYSEEVYRHEYPFSWRRDTDPLIQYARRSWFIRTTREIDRVIANNAAVHWEPEHIKDGRFGSFLRSNVDWALSRERFWGTPLPIWVNDVTGNMQAVASVAEIRAKNPQAFAAFEAAQKQDPSLSEHLMVHKPWIDDVTWTVPGEAGVYRRVPEVIDCWFDSGCMPFAQWGYPHQNRAEFERHYPADFITEAIDQTRGWFYSLMAVNTLLFPQQPAPHPFRNCVVLGHIGDEKGQKLSKSKKNYTDPMLMMEAQGGDAVRWALYTGTVPGQGTRFGDAAVVDALREFVLKIWNVYSFFVTYANIDGWAGPRVDSMASTLPGVGRSNLDLYILAELDNTIGEVRRALDAYQSHIAARAIENFAEALSNWYVRRSRARFWAQTDSTDKTSAFETLYTVLVELSKLIAPFVPFMAEALYQNLVARLDSSQPQSVHLASYPTASLARANEPLRAAVDTIRDMVALGQRVRAERKLKVRQPLSEAIVAVADDAERERLQPFADAIREELNVHAVTFTEKPERYVTFELVPNFRALGPKLGKDMPLVKQLLSKADGGALHAALERDGAIELALPSGPLRLGPEELQVRLQAKADYAAAASHGHVVVLDTRVSDDLRREGTAREVVNRIQRARKTLDLQHEARIKLQYRAQGELADAIAKHADYIMAETLALELTAAQSGKGDEQETDVDGSPLVFWLERA
jgi:isoleucyl-tRNA synthetase